MKYLKSPKEYFTLPNDMKLILAEYNKNFKYESAIQSEYKKNALKAHLIISKNLREAFRKTEQLPFEKVYAWDAYTASDIKNLDKTFVVKGYVYNPVRMLGLLAFSLSQGNSKNPIILGKASSMLKLYKRLVQLGINVEEMKTILTCRKNYIKNQGVRNTFNYLNFTDAILDKINEYVSPYDKLFEMQESLCEINAKIIKAKNNKNEISLESLSVAKNSLKTDLSEAIKDFDLNMVIMVSESKIANLIENGQLNFISKDNELLPDPSCSGYKDYYVANKLKFYAKNLTTENLSIKE